MNIYQILTAFLLTTTNTAFAEKISFETNTRYKKNADIQFSEAKAGDSLQLEPGESLIAVSQQGIPVLIYSSKNKDNVVTIKNSDFSSLMGEELQPVINKTVSEIIDGTRKAETLIQKRDYQQALTVITPLKAKYKNISTVLFLSGTVYFLLNNKPAAIEDLEKGLELDPENTPAKNLLAKLKAGAR